MGQAQGTDGTDGTDGRLLADRYRLGEVLGKGGMGTVWQASDETLGRIVAVKELRFPGNVDDDEKRRLVTRTLREAKATARIRNTGAITVFDVVEEDDRPWIVMELVEGRSLSDAIREDGPLTPKRAAEVALVVLDVLRAAHKEGILHRDVKPSNVLMGTDGRVVLSDFGIAQIDGDPSVTSTGMLVGAPSYISPERARGQKPGPPADLWSLGALLYASVEGRPPYDRGSAIATLTAVMTEPVGPMPNAGPLAEVIRGLLAKDPEQRLDDAGARRLLTAVANAPERSDTPAVAETRTFPLPADPQPTPTDAPRAARKAADEQARVRDALRSVRNAATPKPKPVAESAAAAKGPTRAPLTDVIPRRTVIVAAAVALAVIGTLIGFALSGDGGSDAKGTHSGPASSAPATGDGGATPGGHSPSTGATADGGKSGSTPSAGSTGSQGAGTPSSGAGGLPAGWTTVTNPLYHFSIALPPGWKQTGSTTGGGGAIYSAEGSKFPRVQVDFTSSPHTDAEAEWRKAEPGVAKGTNGYRLLSITSVQYKGYPSVADWSFLRTQSDTAVHVRDRGFVVDTKHGYAIMYTAPADRWNTPEVQRQLRALDASFKPVD